MSARGSQSKSDIFQKFSQYVSSGKARFFQENGIEFVFGRREGPFVWDIDGQKQLIDCHCNGGVFNLGHRHPRIVHALEQALRQLDIGNHHFVSAHRARLAEKLAEITPGDLQYTVFGVSGGEAIDTAIKIARSATGRRNILSVKGGYHGHTGYAVAAGDSKFSAPFLAESPEFVRVPFNDAATLEQTLNTDFAAVLVETIPATLGMPIPDEDYFSRVKQRCEAVGALLIIDEVQTGLGRTGRAWGIEHYGVVPDILVTGKGLSGGIYPMTATVIRPELETVFHDDPFVHISTFGGAEIGCAVAEEVLAILKEPLFLTQVYTLAQIFEHGLAQLQSAFTPLFQEVRQKGLMIGLKMADPALGQVMTKACFETGLLCVFAGNDPSVVQFLPPLIIEPALAEEILTRLEKALKLTAQWVNA
ncbi:MAG: aspartate aminotransferase family protein [candidate division KSB1 bacterium]|nr:aspartate aminotransferase family protein [candidate division KSB1 bacterium]MDQ7064339.1 aspartate aminotransferase family protein [candidate division KSB1 bacterium]